MSSNNLRMEPRRVLIVEDESIQGISLENQLQRLGHMVVGHAASATEAMSLFLEKQPDMVLLDIRLDHEDGIDLARKLLKERRCPMIIISAYSEPQMIQRAGEVGVYGYLIKPVTAELLAAQIEVCTQRYHDSEVLRMEKEQLQHTLETRKILEKAKGIYMKRLNLDEPEAHRKLQQESQKRRIGIAELAKKIIESEELLGG